jgi:hypothetical protein
VGIFIGKERVCFIAHRPQILLALYEQASALYGVKEILLLQIKQLITHYEVDT